MDAPLVSIVITSFNYEVYLEEAIISVLKQEYKNIEVILIDDGSTDNSLDVAKKIALKDLRLKIFTHADNVNMGLPKTLALGLSKCTGVWVAFLDSDDIWKTDCITKRLERATETSSSFIINDIEPFANEEVSVGWFRSYVPRVIDEIRITQNNRGLSWLGDKILLENFIPTFSCVMVKKEILESIDLNAPVSAWLDWYIWSQVLQSTRVTLVDSKLTRWRLHSDSQNRKKKLTKYLLNLSRFRLSIFKLNCSTYIKQKRLLCWMYSFTPNSVILFIRCFKGVLRIGLVPYLLEISKRLK